MNLQEEHVDNAQIGRILHYVTQQGSCLPGIVLEQKEPGVVKLQVFGSHEYKEEFLSIIPNHTIKKQETWHWPRECEHLKNASG